MILRQPSRNVCLASAHLAKAIHRSKHDAPSCFVELSLGYWELWKHTGFKFSTWQFDEAKYGHGQSLVGYSPWAEGMNPWPGGKDMVVAVREGNARVTNDAALTFAPAERGREAVACRGSRF